LPAFSKHVVHEPQYTRVAGTAEQAKPLSR
jgi:hypothetical protein